MQRPVPGSGESDGDGQAHVVVGLVAAPGPCLELAESLLPELPNRIAERLPGARWTVRFSADRLVVPPAALSDLVSAARRRLLGDSWQLVVCVTDLPLQTARRPVVAHASPTPGVAVLSLPALGAVGLRRQASEAIVRLVAALLGDVDRGDNGDRLAMGPPRRSAVTRRVRQLGSRIEPDERGIGLVAHVVTGNLRLLLGMLRANRPWRLAVGLSRFLVAAVGAGVLALVTSDSWRLADGLGSLRLSVLAGGSVLATMPLVAGADLWERSPRPEVREQVILFNVVTVATVVIGVLALYVALLTLTSVAALVLVPGGLLAAALGHAVGVTDEGELAWLATSIAMVGGALGAGLETDDAVREAAYAYHPDERLSAGRC